MNLINYQNEFQKLLERKYFSSEIAVEISTDAVQVLGGYGYTKDFPAERYYRDSKLCTIGEGTSEIQKIVISKQIIK